MEYTQWAQQNFLRNTAMSLNPCCNGIYSMRIETNQDANSVLILVVMEYTQWVKHSFIWIKES